jgi:hypothetical protein
MTVVHSGDLWAFTDESLLAKTHPDQQWNSFVVQGDPASRELVAMTFGYSPEGSLRRARLVAAAPAMLEALKDIRSWLLDSGQLIDDGISHPAFVKANNAANAAIDLATGEMK